MASKTDVRVPASYPSLKLSDIVHILRSLEDKYHELGVQLDVGIDQLKQIEGRYDGNTRRFAEMIGSWQNKSENCTWSALAVAVDRVGGYDNLVKKLRARHAFITSTGDVESSEDTGYATKSYSASPDSSGSEIEHFDKVPGCGCDRPCSLYALCAGECPNPTNKKVGVVRKRKEGQAVQRESLPEVVAEEEDYAEQFEKQTRQIILLFAMLVTNICDSFEKRKLAIGRVILFLQNAHRLALKPKMDEMWKATSLEAVFTIVTAQACSWFDYKMIKDLICMFGDANDKKLLDDYEKEYKSFAEQRKLPKGKKHIEVGSGAREGCKQLVIKIDREWDHVNFNDLDRIRSNLASILKVKRSDLYLADVREGCIMMTFMITEELARRLFPTKSSHTSSKLLSYLTPSQIKSLRDEGVILFMCGNFSWRSAAEQRESELLYSEGSGMALQPQCDVQQKGDEFHDLATCIQGEMEEEQKRKGDSETDHEKVEEVDPSHTSNQFNPPRIKESIMRPTDYDQGCTHTDDPELEKIKEAIFAQFVRLHSHSASSNTAVFERICPNSESTTRQPQESSRGASVGSSTLLMQISTVATAQKDPYPKACYSTRRPAQFISNPHCSVEASTPVPPGPNSKSSRPGKLSLPLIHKWIPSATGSDHSSGETTHTQDPPTELKSSGGELTSSYSPLSTAQSDCGERLIRSAEHATVAETSSSQASCTTTQGKAHHFSSAASGQGQERLRLWSLTESGNFKREEDGLEDIELSISELEKTVNSLTNLSSVVSASPVHTSPSFSRISQSAASSGHSSSWMVTQVRRMSTSAAVIYELVKDLFIEVF